MATSIDQDFVEFIVKSLVNNPDAVSIERRIDEKGVLLELTVDAEDLGRVIGKRGATAQSLRTLLRALGTKNEARYNLKIVDVDRPEEERGQRQTPVDDVVADEPVSSSDDTASVSDDSAVDVQDDEALPEEEAVSPDPEEPERESDAVARTRKELADLDDLDI